MAAYLPRDRAASTHTCETYAYSLMLLLRFAAERLSVKPSQIDLAQINARLAQVIEDDHRNFCKAQLPRGQQPPVARQNPVLVIY